MRKFAPLSQLTLMVRSAMQNAAWFKRRVVVLSSFSHAHRPFGTVYSCRIWSKQGAVQRISLANLSDR